MPSTAEQKNKNNNAIEVIAQKVDNQEKIISQEDFVNFVNEEIEKFERETNEEMKNFNSIGLEQTEFEKIKQEDEIEKKLVEITNEVKNAINDAEKEAEASKQPSENQEGASFNRDEFVEEIKSKIEKIEKLEDAFPIIREINEKQKSRTDLKLLFDNFKFARHFGEEKATTIEEYFDENIKDVDQTSMDKDTLEEANKTPIEEIKKEFKEGIEDLIPPILNLENGDMGIIKKIQDKVSVTSYVPDLVKFLNEYKGLPEGRKKIAEELIFNNYVQENDSPKKKDNFSDVIARLNELISDPSIFKKIDLINSKNLDETLKDFIFFEEKDSYSSRNNVDEFKKLSPASLELVKKNDYFKIKTSQNHYNSVENLNLIDENVLKDIKEFAGNIEELDSDQIIFYKKHIENLSPEIKNFYKKAYQDNNKPGEFDFRYTEFFNLIETEGNFDKIKNGYENGLISDLGSYDLSRLVSFEKKDVDLIIKSGEDLRIDKDLLTKLENTSDEDILKYKEIKKELTYAFSGEKLAILKYIENLKTLSNEESKFFEKWKDFESGTYKVIENYAKFLDEAKNDKENFAQLAKFYNEDSNAEYVIFDLIAKKYYQTPSLYMVAANFKRFKDDPKKYLLGDQKEVMKNFDKVNSIIENNGQSLTPEELNIIFKYILQNEPTVLMTENNKFPFNSEQKEAIDFLTKNIWALNFKNITENVLDFKASPKKYFLENSSNTFANYEVVKKYLDENNQVFDQTELDLIFTDVLNGHYQIFLEKNDFPFTSEQKKVIDIFMKISNSPSHEMKNMAMELSMQLVKGGDLSNIDERYEKIDNIFVKNNIPFVGKQAKICEALHPEIITKDNSSPELQSLHSNNARRLLIFKDLMRANFNSLNSNLEQYLSVFKNGQDVLDKYEKGEELTKDEEEKLKYFFKKINALSENIKKTDDFDKFSTDDLSLADNLQALKSNFGVKENQTITEKFETTFLNRAGIKNFTEALNYYDNLRNQVTNRNKELAQSGQIDLGENDLAKGVSINYFDSNLDRGIYAPEFIGAESSDAKDKSKNSDATPWDTDLIKVGNRNSVEIVEKSKAQDYGDAILIIKDRGQFNKNEKGQPLSEDENKLELFKTGYLGEDHYGIRTGFGSTEIDALLVKDKVLENIKQLDFLKFSIAQKGFYIPICDKSGKVIYTASDFEEYKKIFAGVDKYHGGEVEVSEEWKKTKFNEEINKFAQTDENLDKIKKIKVDIYSDIENDLKTLGIELHKGRYDDSVVGAKIIDTGSTGRGAALDEGYDFDFVIKIDDRDENKINQMAEVLKRKYPYDQDYERSGMRTFRFKSFEKDGNKIDLDISFVKKSDSEELDANEAVAQKYDSIKKVAGEEKLLDVLTNVRFAKKELKKAGCYKKGLTGNGEQQGGLGGIGVENWILKNGGDAVGAFREFNKSAFQEGKLLSFEDFKNKYKIFSAGSNIRGGVRAENFVYNMDEAGYQKMAELSNKFLEN
jgi:hypothetical protein